MRKDEDRRLLARILVAVASADQILAEEEKAFLASFIDPDLGTIEQLSSAGEPTAEELTAIEAGAGRETILALAWALALIDEDLDRSERSLLDRLAVGLEISPGQSLVLKQKAQLYILDRVLGQYLLDSPFALEDYSHDILLVAAHIGLDPITAETAIAAYRRRAEESTDKENEEPAESGEDEEPVAQA